MRKKYALVRFQIKNDSTKDNTITDMSLVDVATSKKSLEKQITNLYEELKNDKWENYTILLFTENEIKFMSKMFNTVTTYMILEK